MGWVHRHRHRGALLALIALALQIALTFGHVHLHGLRGSAHSMIVKQMAPAHAPSQTPGQNRGSDDDYCAACASIFLASSAFASAPPQLCVPSNFGQVDHYFDVARPFVESPRLAFRSRAPPIA